MHSVARGAVPGPVLFPAALPHVAFPQAGSHLTQWCLVGLLTQTRRPLQAKGAAGNLASSRAWQCRNEAARATPVDPTPKASGKERVLGGHSALPCPTVCLIKTAAWCGAAWPRAACLPARNQANTRRCAARCSARPRCARLYDNRNGQMWAMLDTGSGVTQVAFGQDEYAACSRIHRPASLFGSAPHHCHHCCLVPTPRQAPSAIIVRVATRLPGTRRSQNNLATSLGTLLWVGGGAALCSQYLLSGGRRDSQILVRLPGVHTARHAWCAIRWGGGCAPVCLCPIVVCYLYPIAHHRHYSFAIARTTHHTQVLGGSTRSCINCLAPARFGRVDAVLGHQKRGVSGIFDRAFRGHEPKNPLRPRLVRKADRRKTSTRLRTRARAHFPHRVARHARYTPSLVQWARGCRFSCMRVTWCMCCCSLWVMPLTWCPPSLCR